MLPLCAKMTEAHVCTLHAARRRMEDAMKIRLALAFATMTFAPIGAVAQSDVASGSQDEQYACIGDAFSVCGHEIPDRNRVAACLAKNIKAISPACRTVMKRYPKPSAAQPRQTAERRYEPESEYPRQRYDYDPIYPDERYPNRRYDDPRFTNSR
jgi:hypothetical protein